MPMTQLPKMTYFRGFIHNVAFNDVSSNSHSKDSILSTWALLVFYNTIQYNTVQYKKLYWSLMRKLQFLLPAVAYYIQRKDILTHYLELLKRVTAWGAKELKYLEVLAFGTLILPLRSIISPSNSSLRGCVASFSMSFNFLVTRLSYIVCQDRPVSSPQHC